MDRAGMPHCGDGLWVTAGASERLEGRQAAPPTTNAASPAATVAQDVNRTVFPACPSNWQDALGIFALFGRAIQPLLCRCARDAVNRHCTGLWQGSNVWSAGTRSGT